MKRFMIFIASVTSVIVLIAIWSYETPVRHHVSMSAKQKFILPVEATPSMLSLFAKGDAPSPRTQIANCKLNQKIEMVKLQQKNMGNTLRIKIGGDGVVTAKLNDYGDYLPGAELFSIGDNPFRSGYNGCFNPNGFYASWIPVDELFPDEIVRSARTSGFPVKTVDVLISVPRGIKKGDEILYVCSSDNNHNGYYDRYSAKFSVVQK